MSDLVDEIQKSMDRIGLTVTGLALRAYIDPRMLYRRLSKPDTFTLGEFAAVVRALGWSREQLVQALAKALT